MTLKQHTFHGCPVGDHVTAVNSDTAGNSALDIISGGGFSELLYVGDQYSPAIDGAGDTTAVKTTGGSLGYYLGGTHIRVAADFYLPADPDADAGYRAFDWLTVASSTSAPFPFFTLRSTPTVARPRALVLLLTNYLGSPDTTTVLVDNDFLILDTWMRMRLDIDGDNVTVQVFDVSGGSPSPYYSSPVMNLPGLQAQAQSWGYVTYGPADETGAWVDNLYADDYYTETPTFTDLCTFEDDFGGNTLDPDKWDPVDGTNPADTPHTVAGNVDHIAVNAAMYSHHAYQFARGSYTQFRAVPVWAPDQEPPSFAVTIGGLGPAVGGSFGQVWTAGFQALNPTTDTDGHWVYTGFAASMSGPGPDGALCYSSTTHPYTGTNWQFFRLRRGSADGDHDGYALEASPDNVTWSVWDTTWANVSGNNADGADQYSYRTFDTIEIGDSAGNTLDTSGWQWLVQGVNDANETTNTATLDFSQVTGVCPGVTPTDPVGVPGKAAQCMNILDLIGEYATQIARPIQVNTLYDITVLDPAVTTAPDGFEPHSPGVYVPTGVDWSSGQASGDGRAVVTVEWRGARIRVSYPSVYHFTAADVGKTVLLGVPARGQPFIMHQLVGVPNYDSTTGGTF